MAARLAVECAVAHVVDPRGAPDVQTVELLRAEARKTNVEWFEEVAENAPRRLIELARSRPETTIAVAGTLRQPRLMQRPSFARRLLDEGARELLVLMPPASA